MARRNELITFKPTETVRKLAAKANQIQDACNSRAVARFLIEVQDHFSDDKESNDKGYCGGDMAAQNPISIAVLNKLNDLAGLEQTRTDCFVAILDLAEGKEIQWEINFLM